MPLKRCQADGQQGWKWGDAGKCYVGEGAREKALKQGRAVEMSKNIQASHDVIYVPQEDTTEWSCADEKEHTYIKELIYEGKFRLPGGVDLSVTPDVIDHWADTFKEMNGNGVSVPLPLGHKTDAEANRGQIVDMYAGTNPRGERALYAKAKFRDEEATKLAKTSQVSIFSPPEFIDGKGNRYTRPITHVALTDYPVIPALQGFQSIAASFVPSGIGEDDMPLKEVAAKLKIECENDEQLEDTIVASFETLTKESADKDKAIEEKDAEIVALKARIPKDPITVTASHKQMLRDNRVMKLDRLVGEKISPAVKDGLVDLFCSDASLTLSLSTEDGDGGMFDKLIETLEKNAVVQLGDADEIISLGKDGIGDPEKNPLLADAQARAKAQAS